VGEGRGRRAPEGLIVGPMHTKASRPFSVAPVALVLSVVLASVGCGGSPYPDPTPAPAPTGPLFTDPVVKIAQTGSERFTWTIYQEAIALQPLLAAAGTQVHMGYYSGSSGGRSNRDRLMALIDVVNAPPPGTPPRWMIWDEGISTAVAGKYPYFVVMEREHWWDRAVAEAGGFDTVVIDGVRHVDPYPVTYVQWDQIWGNASDRYAETAATFHWSTQTKVKAWAYVTGARSTGIFYKYECPMLGTLSYWGHVEVRCSAVADADWENPLDWCDCTATCTPCQAPP
jgi:hypothetical protein